ncbi:MAG: pantetheine-phosphate adenylyltransferase [Lachnospiraceae bacterium]|nr:pantetheine-phosphate adenylyltransferase [Lachnospiraceae bacterium]MDN4742588.1 pantetheine-phosphate adenylyltransferase [Lachnospiraceae bacterium C1.1]
MARAIYPGSFDPVTYGHLDIIKRAADIFDDLTVSVLSNSSKSPLFSVDERVNMLKEVCADLKNVHITSYSGLLAEYAEEKGFNVIIRGLRAITDFEYELQMAQTNHKISPSVDTVFLTTSLEYAYLSSSIVREVARYGGDIHHFVPEIVAEQVYAKAGIEKNGKQ